HTTALLEAIPLSEVTKELPGLVSFMSTTLKISPTQLAAALKANFPGIAQSVSNLPAVTSGWNNVPGAGSATNHEGQPLNTVPAISDYYNKEVIPVLESRRGDYDNLTSKSKINFLGPLVLAVGIIVIAYGILMIFLAGGPPRPRLRGAASTAAAGPSAE